MTFLKKAPACAANLTGGNPSFWGGYETITRLPLDSRKPKSFVQHWQINEMMSKRIHQTLNKGVSKTRGPGLSFS